MSDLPRQAVSARKGTRITDEERDHIVSLYANGYTMRTVSRLVNRSYGAVNMVLHKSGETAVKSRGGYRRLAQPATQQRGSDLSDSATS